MMETRDTYLWVEKYRPQIVKDCVLPERMKEYFQKIVDGKQVQNMLLVGGPGTGKTTIAKAICNELGLDYLMINASENGNIDTLRTTIRGYASSVSFDGGAKVVILDEADFLNPQSTQPALRNFIEEFSNNCRFILTANYANKIIDPLKSRLNTIEFSYSKEEKASMAMSYSKRLKQILQNENVEYDDKTLAQLIIKYSPDFRKILNELQRHTTGGVLKSDVLSTMSEAGIKLLIKNLKEKDWGQMRKWVVENIDNDFNSIVTALYENMSETVQSASIPQLVLILGEYDYKNAFVVNKEINIVSMLTEIMRDVEFK